MVALTLQNCVVRFPDMDIGYFEIQKSINKTMEPNQNITTVGMVLPCCQELLDCMFTGSGDTNINPSFDRRRERNTRGIPLKFQVVNIDLPCLCFCNSPNSLPTEHNAKNPMYSKSRSA